MGACKALIMAGAALIGPAAAALAADLPPPPMVEMAPEPVDIGGWYLRGDAGVGFATRPDIRSTFADGYEVPDFHVDRESVGTAPFIGAGLGYAWNSWLRFDATGEYRFNHTFNAVESYDCASFGCTNDKGDHRAFDKYVGSVESGVFLVNGYVDLGTWYGFSPFIGAGVGGAYHHLDGTSDHGIGGASGFGQGGFGNSSAKDQLNFAWAAMAGIDYSLTQNLKLELGYRYLDMGTVRNNAIWCESGCSYEIQRVHLASHDVRLGLRWLLNDVTPVAPIYPPPPIVRKY